MDVAGLLIEIFGRVPDLARGAVAGLSQQELIAEPAPGVNPIAWLVWHSARIQDAQVAEVAGHDQVWVEGTWAEAFGLTPDPRNHGYTHTPADVATVRPHDTAALLDYLDAVCERTRQYLEGLSADDLDRVVDDRWDPPVTLGVRLVSIVDDDLQHLGQAAYARGFLTAG